MWLPMGCDLKGGKIKLGNEQGSFKGKKLAYKDLQLNCESIKAVAMQYLYAPYQWGGRSVAGIDCSGLTQMAFKLCGKELPRDAALQAQDGDAVDFLQHGRCGDLAFFDNAEGKIVHVGILLDHDTIIHATEMLGRVTIDRIDQGGIISTTLRKRTHQLRLVKRYF
jgi:cell wall-associated NlpC family hydrolase